MPWRPAFGVRAAGSDLAFFVHHRDTIGRHIAKYGTHEPLVTRWMAEFLSAAPRGIAIDIGANLGWHAAARGAASQCRDRWWPSSPIRSMPGCWNAISRKTASTTSSSKTARSVPRQAWPKLHRYKGANYGRHSIAADHGYGSRSVPVTDLDGALAALGLADRPVSLIKIDVEGYEPAVIDRRRAARWSRTDALIVEYSPDSAAPAASRPRT